ncbi:hypothetical protein TALC_00570 [Thermoplasmatales archaeon BRNA1]|nr:hypothetical protein TALC_00570 [Thermoplasmatales archaeon BRNA1]
MADKPKKDYKFWQRIDIITTVVLIAAFVVGVIVLA